MKNKGIKILTELSALVLFATPGMDAVAATVLPTPSVNISKPKQNKENNKTSTANKNKSKSVVYHPTSNTRRVASDASEKGFTWDRNDPNIIEKNQTIINPNTNDPTFYNQLIVHKTGTPGFLKKGDVLTVTTVATMLDGVNSMDEANKEATRLVSAIPNDGNTFNWGTTNSKVMSTLVSGVNIKATKQQLDVGKNDSLDAVKDPSDVSSIGNGSRALASTLSSANSNNVLYLLKNDGQKEHITDSNFKFFNANLGMIMQNYAYLGASNNNSKGKNFYDHMNVGEHIYDTYQINYIGVSTSKFSSKNIFGTGINPFDASNKNSFGVFGMIGQGTGVSSTENTELFEPIDYSDMKVSGLDVAAKNVQGNDTSDKAEATSDFDLQNKEPKMSGSWNHSSGKVSVYYKINQNQLSEDDSKTIKLADSDVNQTAKTFSTNIKTDANNKFVDGENYVTFYVKDYNSAQEGSAVTDAYYQVKKTTKPVINSVVPDPATIEKGKEEDVKVTGEYTSDDPNVTMTYKIDDGAEKKATASAKNKTAASAASQFDFTIPKADLSDLTVDTHTINVYATDSQGRKSDVKTANLEVTKSDDSSGGGNTPVGNKPVVNNLKADPNSIEKGKESDVKVTGDYISDDPDTTAISYKVDNGSEMKASSLTASKTKSTNPMGYNTSSIIKKPKSINKIVNPFGSTSLGDFPAERDIFPDPDGKSGNSMHFKISYTKSGSPNATAVGDKVHVTVKATAVTPYTTPVEDKKVFMKASGTAFAFPKLTTGGAFDISKPNAAMYRKNDDKVQDAAIIDDNTAQGYQMVWDASVDGGDGYDIKDSMTDPTEYQGATNHDVSSANASSKTVPQVAFNNNMQAGDYFQFTYAATVNKNAAGLDPTNLRLLAADFNDLDTGFENFIAAQLPGGKITPVSITPDQASYSPELTQSEMDNYSQTMTGTYDSSDGSVPKISYEVYNVNSSSVTGHEAPGKNAIAVKDVSDGKYSADVSAKLVKGDNTVRFFVTGSDGTSSYADVAVNVTKKVDTTPHPIDFTIPRENLEDLSADTHKIHVFATDSSGQRSDDKSTDLTVTQPSDSNIAPEVSDTKVSPKEMEKGKESELDVNGKWKDVNDDDITKMTYSIDGSDETETAFTKDGQTQKAAKKAKAKTVSVPSVVKKAPIPAKLIGKNGVQPLEGEDESSTDITTPDGGIMHYEMSYKKTGDQTSTAVGDEVTVTSKVTAVKPKAKKINGQDTYMSLLNSAFVSIYATDGSPFKEIEKSAEMYRADGSAVASIPLFDEANGAADSDPFDSIIHNNKPITGNPHSLGITSNYENFTKSIAHPDEFNGKSVKGSMSFDFLPANVYDDNQFTQTTQTGEGAAQPYSGILPGDKDYNQAHLKDNVSYITFHNHMTKNDYVQFTYKYKVNENAIGTDTDNLKFYSGVYDSTGGNSGIDYIGNIISDQLPGNTVTPVGITPDQDNYDEEYSASEMDSAKIPMTGKYSVGEGDSAVIKYAVNDTTDTTAPADATDVTPNADGTYSTDVLSNGKFHEGPNTVRFYIASKKDSKQNSYSDVTVNITKTVSDHTYDFDIPKAVLSKLNVGTHTVKVYAYDVHGAKSAEVDGSKDTFEILKASNTAPVVDSLLDENNKSANTVAEGYNKDYPLTLNWHDAESKSVTGTYTIKDTSDNTITTGDLGTLENSSPGDKNVKNFAIPAEDMAKLKHSVGAYNVKVQLTDDSGLTSDANSAITYTIMVSEPIPDLVLPDSLTFADVNVGKQRQLDTRDQGWDKIKLNNQSKHVTVYQSKAWTSSNSNSLSSIEFVSGQDQLDSKRGTSIYGAEAAANVEFKSDGSLNWNDSDGLFEPIATSDLADSYTTELTWQVTDAP